MVVGSSIDKIYMVMEYCENDLKIDLKSSNLLYSNKGVLCVCDFGLARKYGEPIAPYTHEVVTLWYRAPELLLGSRTYSTPIDMWSVGCIFAEMVLGDPLFPGQGELDQISKIFTAVGAPNETLWPGFADLPNVNQISKRIGNKGKLGSLFPKISNTGLALNDTGYELLTQMLTMDPSRRITAANALKHRWLTEETPRPTPTERMPTFKDINPENILINPHTHQLKLADFSCAKKIRNGYVYSVSECEVGAVHFRAPEMLCRCKNVTGFATDVWAAGCLLAECLMNCDLFTGKIIDDMLGNIVSCKEFKPARDIRFVHCDKIGVEGRMKIRRDICSPHKKRPALNAHGIDLLTQIFVFVARERILPLDACQHPFFSSLFAPGVTTPEGFPLPVELFSFTPQELSGRHKEINFKRVTQLRDRTTPTHRVNDTANMSVDAQGWYRRRENFPESSIDYWFGDDASCCVTATNSVCGESEDTSVEEKVEVEEEKSDNMISKAVPVERGSGGDLCGNHIV
eukprot:gene24031-30327_t